MFLRKRGDRNLPLLALFFIGIVLLILNGCGGGTSGNPTTGGNNTCSGASNIVSCSAQSDLRIDVGNAPQMQVHDSQEIKVELLSLSGSSISNAHLSRASVPAENATVTTTAANPVGTPDAPLQFAFGSGYEPFATATLSPNPAFTFIPLGDTAREQPLNQSSILWRWSVLANKPGFQIVDVNIEAMWKPLSKGLPEPQSVSIGNAQISIQITTLVPTPTPTPTSVPTPTPTPTSAPTLTPTSTSAPTSTHTQTSSTTSDPLSFVSNIATLLGMIWTVVFGGKAINETEMYKALRSKEVRLRPPKALTITNILLGLIFIVLVWLVFHPTLLPHP